MKLKLINPISMLINSLIYIVVGILFICFSNIGLEILVFICEIIILLVGALMAGSAIFAKGNARWPSLVGGILLLSAGALMLFEKELLGYSLAFFAGIWAFINFFWRMVLCIQLHKNHDNGFWRSAFDCLVSLIFAILFLFNPVGNVGILAILIGAYLIIHGAATFADFIREILKWDIDGKHIKRHIHWSAPVLFTAFIPKRIVEKINKALESNEAIPEVIETQKFDGEEIETKLEVFIHISPNVAMGFGHCDICFDGIVYSYGTYDESTYKLNGVVCDGVLAKIPVQRYIDHCIKVSKEHIVAFSIYLSKEQEENLRAALDKMNQNLVRWECPAEETKSNDCSDYASGFYYATGAEFYKFKKGRFKTYFVVSTNCVMLADTIIKAAGINGIKMNGIVTPGSYLAFLNEQFSRKNTIVVKRRILV